MVEPVKEPVKVSLSDILCHLSNQGNFMFFSKVVSSLPILRTKSVPIIGVTLTPNGYMLLVNEEGIDQIPSLEFLIMLIEHEVHHIVLEHQTRALRKYRSISNEEEKFYAKQIVPITMDLAVNDLMKNYSKHSGQMYDDKLGGVIPGKEPYKDLPRNKSFEQYYDLVAVMASDEKSKVRKQLDELHKVDDQLKGKSTEFKEGFIAGYRDRCIENIKEEKKS
jgi:predicted metal-dependent peptidase